MSDCGVALSRNQLVRFLGKPRAEFTKADLIRFIEKNDVAMINLRYVAGDGRLKALCFPIAGKSQLDRLLSGGERVDGSSLFADTDAASSDLYVVPRYRTAYVNPFCSMPAVDMLCSYYTKSGERLASSPENIVRKAHEVLKERTGFCLEAMGELEFYVLADRQDCYPVTAQKGYQESAPFFKWACFRCEAMQAIAAAGGNIKYGHSEVGNIPDERQDVEQHEIEFSPEPLEDAADQILVAKWMLRMLAYKRGVTVTFAPKLMGGHAGSGLHIHTKLVKNGKNAMVDGDGLSQTGRKIIAGYLHMASSLTAFGNTVPISYLRLVPHQEAPTNICWGDRNRSVLVRVPLGWLGANSMIKDANPQEPSDPPTLSEGQTVEFRCPDGSANVYLLMAGLAVAAREGLEMPGALKLADKLYVDVNIFAEEHKGVQETLPHLPESCWESGDALLEKRELYQRHGVFPPGAIDGLVKKLQSYKDKDLSERLYGMQDDIRELVAEYLHCS